MSQLLIPPAVLMCLGVLVEAQLEDSTLADRAYVVLEKQNLGKILLRAAVWAWCWPKKIICIVFILTRQRLVFFFNEWCESEPVVSLIQSVVLSAQSRWAASSGCCCCWWSSWLCASTNRCPVGEAVPEGEGDKDQGGRATPPAERRTSTEDPRPGATSTSWRGPAGGPEGLCLQQAEHWLCKYLWTFICPLIGIVRLHH